jgi:hypothetical protein
LGAMDFFGHGSVKNNVVQLLAEESPLSAKQLHARLARRFGINVSYQAVHKTLTQMVNEEVLSKSGGKYFVNGEWVKTLKTNVEGLSLRFMDNEKEKKIDSLNENESVSYSFNGLVDAGWFLIDKVMNAPNEKKMSLALWRFSYSIMGLEQKHIARIKEALAKSNWSIVVEGENELDKMFGKIFESYGAKVFYGVKCASMLSDKFIVGDYVSEVTYPSKLRNAWANWFKSSKKVTELAIETHIAAMHDPNQKITVQVTKNTLLAEEYRKEYENYLCV